MTCWPDSARMWAHPAFLKASARSPSSSSRAPATRACNKGPARPPPLPSASIIPARRPKRHVSRTLASAVTRISSHSAKRMPPVPRDEPDRRISVPRASGLPPRTNSLTRPRALAFAPSLPNASRKSRTYAHMPAGLMAGSETTLAPIPSTVKTADTAPGVNPPPARPARLSIRVAAHWPSARPIAKAQGSLSRAVG